MSVKEVRVLLSVEALHIPDGFLSVLISAILWIVSILVVVYSLRRVGQNLDERGLPLLGVLAAGIFAGQMLNFAVAGGTSGHLMGAALATILAGPWAAILIMISVVSIQALIFQDGGLLVLGAKGANIFNMAIIGVTVSYMAYRTGIRAAGNSKRGILAAGFSAAWLSVFIVSLSVGIQLALSGTSPTYLAIPAMAGVHALIGVGEGLITIGALSFLLSTRPGLIQPEDGQSVSGRVVWLTGLLIALALVILSPLASTRPDGLEWVAIEYGFIDKARDSLFQIIPGYELPGISPGPAATIAAGILGVVLVLFALAVVMYTRHQRQISGK
jgi:cobalt/nickel transport system permease protein